MENSTKKCRECKADIPADAKVCQHCKAKQGNWFSRHKILTGILIIFIIGILGNANTSKLSTEGSTTTTGQTQITKEEEKEVAITITAKELFAQYEANEIQADEKYKNKRLEVSWEISNIGKDILDNPYIALKTTNAIWSVQCMLADSEKSKASQLQKGGQITLEGKNTGKLGNVILRDCKIK